MAVGRILYLLGMLFVLISIVVLIMVFFTNGGNILIPIFGLLNGFIAMGVGDIVIDLNYKKRLDNKSDNPK